jgi:hypothetical protein
MVLRIKWLIINSVTDVTDLKRYIVMTTDLRMSARGER